MAGRPLRHQDGSLAALGRVKIILRMICSYASNGIIRAVILWTLPIYMASSTASPIDFVLNASALGFIHEFDDADGSSEYTIDSPQAADDDAQEAPSALPA